VAALTVQQLEGDRARPDGITVIAAPMDPAAAPTQVSALAAESGARGLPPNAVQRVGLDRPGAGREVVPGLVQLWSMLFQAPSEHLARHWRLVGRRISGDHAEAEALAEFYDRYVAVIDLDAALYRETLRRVFTERELAAGRATWRGRALDPSGIRDVGVQTIEGGADDICAPGQTRAAHAILSGVPKTLRDHLEVPELSHYATFAGRRFRAQVLPRVAAFAYACRDGG
jgi:poly(3-hydroxybutyrate) depolymerase